MKDVLGVVLAGGRATRMGGGDKWLRLIAGKPLIDYVVERLAPQVSALAVSANGDLERLGALGLPVLPDSLPDHPGPLAGVLAGMDWAAEIGAEAIVTAAADTPFFPRDLVSRLQTVGPLALAASLDETGIERRHPTFGLWPVSLREDLRSALKGGLRKVGLWADRHGAETAVFSAEEVDGLSLDPFFNVNTPGDMARAEALAVRS